MNPAQRRGATTRLSGSTPIISMLDNCSVDFISPISAVMEEPALPAKSSAVITGPSSRSNTTASPTPTASWAPKR